MRRSVLVTTLFALTTTAPASAADEPPSLQGYGGLLETPTAFTHAPGSAHLLFTTQVDPRFRGRDMQTYALSVGFFRYLEGAGRVTEGAYNDLSLNVKLRLPLDLVLPQLPLAVAIGAQDLGGTGGSSHFRSRY